MVKSFYKARAMRDLGVLDDKKKQDYKLADTKNTLEVTFRDGKRTFAVGGDVYGDRYILDTATGKGYVLSKELVSKIEVGASSLQLTDPKGFDATKIDSVVIESGGRTKQAKRIETEKDGKKVKTWGDAATAKADATLGTFIDNANNLRPTEYAPTLKVEALTPVVRLTYREATGGALGTLTLFRREKPGVLPEGAELDPANPQGRDRVLHRDRAHARARAGAEGQRGAYRAGSPDRVRRQAAAGEEHRPEGQPVRQPAAAEAGPEGAWQRQCRGSPGCGQRG